jgi:hypothetical protein
MSDAVQGPTVPRDVLLRPLNGGVRREVNTRDIPIGSFYDVEGYLSTEKGLLRRPTTEVVSNGATVLYPPIRRVGSYWTTTSSQFGFVMDAKHIYKVEERALTPVYYTYTTGQITTNGSATIQGSSSPAWDAANIEAGDVLVTTSGTAETLIIASINDVDTLTTTTNAATSQGPVNYAIRRAFKCVLPYIIDYTQSLDGKVYIADQNRPLWEYNGTTLIQHAGSDTYKPVCCLYHAERLWIGNTREGATQHRHRIRWSNAGDPDTFSATALLDLPYQQGELQRLIPLGRNIVACFEDALWIGRPTNIPTLPFAFDHKVSTGGRGPVGMRASLGVPGGIIFVCFDNVFFLDVGGKWTPVGDQIAKHVVGAIGRKWSVWLASDPVNKRIIMAMPGSSQIGAELEDLWSWSLETKQWTHDQPAVTMIESSIMGNDLTWDTLYDTGGADGQRWNNSMAVYPSWSSMRMDIGAPSLFLASPAGELWRYSAIGTSDLSGSTAPITKFETGDLDFKRPNRRKSGLRMSIKLEDPTLTEIAFTVTGSVDRGQTWKSLGTLTIAVGADEGFVSFQLKGSTLRYRVTHSTVISPFTISEVVLRVRIADNEQRAA